MKDIAIHREPWLTTGIKQSMNKNKRLYGELLKTPTAKQLYKDYNQTLCKTLQKAKIVFYKAKCKEFKTQTKKLWRLINEIAGKKNDKSNLVEYLKIDDVQVYSANKISNSFTKYFSGVGKKFAEKIPVPSKPITEYLRLMGSNTKSIFLTPTELPTKNSSGYDNVSNVLLKDVIAHIVEPLSYIFNQSMLTGEFPNSMKPR